MKELTSYNRAAGYLNKIFDLLNDAYFESALSRPTITIQSTPRAYGHFSLRGDTWLSKNGATHEINIGAGTLSRPIEEVTATLLHEMVHYYNYETIGYKGYYDIGLAYWSDKENCLIYDEFPGSVCSDDIKADAAERLSSFDVGDKIKIILRVYEDDSFGLSGYIWADLIEKSYLN